MDCFRTLSAYVKYDKDIMTHGLASIYVCCRDHHDFTPDLNFLFNCYITLKLSRVHSQAHAIQNTIDRKGLYTQTGVLPTYPIDTLKTVSVKFRDNDAIVLAHTYDNQTFELWITKTEYYLCCCFGLSTIRIKTSHNKNRPVELLLFEYSDNDLPTMEDVLTHVRFRDTQK